MQQPRPIQMIGVHGLWLRWVAANAVGEMLGLGTVFTVGVWLAASYGEPRSGVMLVGLGVLVAGLAAFEGAVVGFAQWLVLRRPLEHLSARSWVWATVVGAVIAWVLGMVPSALSSLADTSSPPVAEPPLIVMLGFSAGMGAVAGIILAAAQWWVLRRHVERASLWLVANAVAWACAMPAIFWLVGVTIAEQRTVLSVVFLVLGIGGAGGAAGAVHGVFLLRLLAQHAARGV